MIGSNENTLLGFLLSACLMQQYLKGKHVYTLTWLENSWKAASVFFNGAIETDLNSLKNCHNKHAPSGRQYVQADIRSFKCIYNAGLSNSICQGKVKVRFVSRFPRA